jgi:hypothetical protein
MKQFKLTYPVHLKASGGFCTTPLEIVQQMDAARKNTLRDLRAFLKSEGLEDQVKSITPYSNQIGLLLVCTDDVANKLKVQSFVTSIEEDKQRYLPPKFKAG